MARLSLIGKFMVEVVGLFIGVGLINRKPRLSARSRSCWRLWQQHLQEHFLRRLPGGFAPPAR